MSEQYHISPFTSGKSCGFTVHFSWFVSRVFTLLTIICIVMVGIFSSFDTAEARRMGNGRSFGHQFQGIQHQLPAQRQQLIQKTDSSQSRYFPNTTTLGHSRWFGPIVGLMAGLGIAGLMSHFGFGGMFTGILSNLMIISIFTFFAIWLIRKVRNFQNPNNFANANGGFTEREKFTSYFNDLASQDNPRMYSSNSCTNENSYSGSGKVHMEVPDGFNVDAFLRSSKVNFIRLQAAWDCGNMDDIREFTTPEIFAEIKLDFNERGNERNQTDVVQLDAQLLNIEINESKHIASVRFHGLIRESSNEEASSFEEVWNLSKISNEGWILSGIQQLNKH